MKIVFPKPEDYLHREDAFFEQMELALYHAKKAWQKIAAQPRYKKDEGDYPWLRFVLPDDLEKALEKVDPDYKRREIALDIQEL